MEVVGASNPVGNLIPNVGWGSLYVSSSTLENQGKADDSLTFVLFTFLACITEEQKSGVLRSCILEYC